MIFYGKKNRTKHLTIIYKNICYLLEEWPARKSFLFLQNFGKALQEIYICYYGISFSWNILCVVVGHSNHIFELFSWKMVCAFDKIKQSSFWKNLIWHFFLLENRMYSLVYIVKTYFWRVLFSWKNRYDFKGVYVSNIKAQRLLDIHMCFLFFLLEICIRSWNLLKSRS